nr:pilus assembly protein TadG-related protein [Microlunatus panaciterrae]
MKSPRRKTERGAVSVMVALLIIPLMGFAAISIDVAGMWAERQQLQAGADAAALAIAQDCSRNNCGTPSQTALTFASANLNNGTATPIVITPALAPSTGHVTVQNFGISKHMFAPVLGINQKTVSAQSSANWAYPSGGTMVLPLTFSWCEFKAQTGGGVPSGTTERTVYLSKSSGTSCTGPSNNVVPGGFGWVDPDAGACSKNSLISAVLTSSTGNSLPSGCSTADFQAQQNKTVLLPIFDQAGGTGNNAWYKIYGYAAFKMTGYYFAGQYSWNPPCSGSERCIKGYFTKFVDLTEAYTSSPTAPQLGAAIVSLTQ